MHPLFMGVDAARFGRRSSTRPLLFHLNERVAGMGVFESVSNRKTIDVHAQESGLHPLF